MLRGKSVQANIVSLGSAKVSSEAKGECQQSTMSSG